MATSPTRPPTWGIAKATRAGRSRALFADYDGDGRPGPARDERLRAHEPLPQRRREALRGRLEEGGRGGPRLRHVGDRGATSTATDASTSTRPARTRSGTSCTSTRRCPIGTAGPDLPADRGRLDGEDGDGKLASAPARRPHLRERDRALGRGPRRLELERRRGRSRQRFLADIYVDQRHVGRRARPRHELEFWWDSLAYWDDYVAGKAQTSIATDAGWPASSATGTSTTAAPERTRCSRSGLSRRPRPRDERPRRGRLRRQRRRRARPLRAFGPGPRGALPRQPPRGRALPSASPRGDAGRATTATASGRA